MSYIYSMGGGSMLQTEEINQIRSSVDIVDVISGYLPLTQKGKNFFGVCPFHDDHSPSMSVSREKQIYTCFSCGATGNVFKFLMDYENISFPEAVQKVADRAGIAVDLHIKSHHVKTANQELYDIYEYALKCYQNHLNTESGQAAKEYLHERNINDEVIKEFRIGYSFQKRERLTNMLRKKGYSDKDLLRSGLVIQNEYGFTDIYYDRVMFPLCDMNGRVVGFSGRIHRPGKDFKYINTKETEIFKKGELLYNYHRAKDIARQKNQVIVMEGFMDVIRAFTIDVKNAIATMGTAVTKEQALAIKKMGKEVILCFDGDAAGEKATYACSNELLAIGVVPKIIRLEDNLDPDEYIQKYGKEQFERKIEQPMNVLDFKMLYYKHHRDLQNSMDLANYVNDMIEEVSKVDDEVLRELTLQKVADDSGLTVDFLKEKLEQKEKTIEVPALQPQAKEKTTKKISKTEQAERNLIFYMLRSADVIKMYQKKVAFMPTEEYRFLAREISFYYKTYREMNEADFLTSIADKPKLMATVGKIAALDLKDTYSIEEIDDYIKAIQQYNIQYEIDRMKLRLKEEVDPMKKAKYAEKIVELKRKEEAI